MTWPLGLAIYFTIWWVALFAVLPFGVRSQHEADGYDQGTDPGAPVKTHLLVKMLATTVLAGVIFAGFYWYAFM
jgi:predicted secreted protein